MSGLGHVWTAPWQELSDGSAALVGCGHVSGLSMRQVWPLALMLCADRVRNKNAHFRRSALTQAGSPIPGTTVSALRRRALANWCCRSICWRLSCRQQQFRLLISLAPDLDGAGHPRNLVGERDGRHLGWSTFH